MVFIIEIDFYLPLLFGVARIVLGLLGVIGNVRLYLVSSNACGLGIYVYIAFTAIFGFKEP
ncbi:hypothetical protein A1A1_14869 [Planococcus antarcticus DSM 14505]|uniref:Uncharacterized protein n=1 Tax=Planococcus antarcticus DSM 14505 TaxID=1185653 RepID=A0A1C7DI19_9BACL|nr:hypothetical protein [Planococcus antarcticus]ANU11057.1 hypothetical protein BBH88_12490 [Planococcus antarcticus DSM 14505]EIM05692.1 hypothetical protein A1A1_14869 [Planococcus antarcticus DSM 14505]